ncbi:hypothetical protein [Ornithinimicrobium cavernae]|uniref:hypothetical protein n=1 Tax=Ornithinimicrobium cavernae TaxID=2666047 RepID=UPI000D68EAEA|nr:hypothetical protein [Ornithinimicrobium cavernae]
MTATEHTAAASGPRDRAPAERLVIAYAFAPYADTSAVAATKRVAVQAEPVDVISNAMDSLRGRDDSLKDVVGGLVRRRAVLDTPTMFAGWSSVLSFCRAGQRTLAAWAQEPGGTPYTSVYSRAHFIASHLLAALVVGERPGLHWQAEMSDPLSRKATGELREGPEPRGPLAEELATLLAGRGVRMPEGATVYQWAETVAYTLADEVVFTSDGQRDYCLSLVEDPHVRAALAPKAVVTPHATLPPEWYTRRDPDVLGDAPLAGRAGGERQVQVGYFGGFYASQSPQTLLRAAASLAPEDRGRVRVHLFTGQSEELSAQVLEAGAGDVVRVRDRLPFLDFLAATRQMDLLLAIDAAPVEGDTVPHVRLSKWSDYVGSGTGVWGMVTPGSDLASQDLAVRTPLGHQTATLQVLTSLARGTLPARSAPDARP